MSDFVTAAPARKALEINKRVNYTLGLVLGVDEFDQEQYYFLERSRQHNRALHGYGTICGLALSTDGAQVIVTAGLALNPQGKVITVSRDQCADLNAWLSVEANRKRLSEQVTRAGGLPIDQAVLYVTLCYHECQTDKVPVPGAPCRSEDATLDFSRRLETFDLKFETEPPAEEEELVVRRFGHLLRRLAVGIAGPFVTEAEMAGYVRDLLTTAPGSPPDSPLSSPPGSPLSPPEAPLAVRAEELESILAAAFRVWVTEVRPKILADGKNCGGIPDEDCVLIGALRFGITIDWKVTPDPATTNPRIQLDETLRPFLLHTRLLQEWFMPGSASSGGGGGAAVPGDSVRDERAFGLTSDAGDVLEYSRANHTHGTPDLPATPALLGDVTGPVGASVVERIRGVNVAATAPSDGQVLSFQGGNWQPSSPALLGDVTGPVGTSVVERIRGVNVAATAPTDGQVLAFQGGNWQPASPAGDVTGAPGASTVEKIRGVNVLAAAPKDGQILIFQNKSWRPAGDYVRIPAKLGPYVIVAAGIVKGDGTSRAPVFNNLSATATADGELTVTFDEPAPPASPQYIVKALVVFNKGLQNTLDVKFPLVALDTLAPGKFTLFVTDLGKILPQDRLKQLEFAIEVSRFE